MGRAGHPRCGLRRGGREAGHPVKEHPDLQDALDGGFPGAAIRLIGIAELAGAAGLVLPAVTGIAPVLTPLAATGLALTMTLAAIFHARRHEYAAIPLTVVLFVAAAFTAWARFGPYTT